MRFSLTPTDLIDQLRAWFHPKDRSVFVAEDCFIDMDEQAKPSTNPAVGRDRIYPKAGNNWYVLDSSGTETLLGGGSGLPVHTHANNTQGGQIDWDDVWSDAVHDHSAAGEGGQNLRSIQELEFDNYSELTIAAGAVTRTQVYHSIDTEAGAATDDLDTINGGAEADLLITRQDNDARNVKYTVNGNLEIPSGIDIYSDLASHALGWIYDGQNWLNFANPFGRWSLIAETTLGASAASVTFASIPQTYRHLVLFANARTDRAARTDYMNWQANADAAGNYDSSYLQAFNGGVTSVQTAGATYVIIGVIDGALATGSNFGGGFCYWPNYTNTNMRKVGNSKTFKAGDQTVISGIVHTECGGHWRNTAAITSLTIVPTTGPNFVQYSTFSLYGVL